MEAKGSNERQLGILISPTPSSFNRSGYANSRALLSGSTSIFSTRRTKPTRFFVMFEVLWHGRCSPVWATFRNVTTSRNLRFPLICRKNVCANVIRSRSQTIAVERSELIRITLLSLAFFAAAFAAEDDIIQVRREADGWSADHRIVDLHLHLDCTKKSLARAVKILDAAGVGLGVNLSGGTVTQFAEGGPNQFERSKAITDSLYPGRFVHYMNLDYKDWDQPDFSERAVKQIEAGHKFGAAGLKEYKRLGLFQRDAAGKLIRVDDPKLDPVWKRCGELQMPVSIHVADPKAFWQPYDDTNERWKELKDHKNWWFGDSKKYPPRMEILEALDRVIARHPKTTFVCVHFANNAEELEWVDAALTRNPNMMADLAARIPEIGRHDPEQVRKLFIKHQDRILFATDFQVSNWLILGSSGNEPPPSDADAEVFYAKEWRWLETRDKNWEHMTPIQGDWTISSIGLPAAVLRKIYFDNARKLLARSLPPPVLQARRMSKDFKSAENHDSPLWQTAKPVYLEQSMTSGVTRAELSTAVRALWSESFLYLQYRCPFTDPIPAVRVGRTASFAADASPPPELISCRG